MIVCRVLGLILIFLVNGMSFGQKLIWEENFEGNRLSQKRWNYALGDGCPEVCGWGNHERQVYRKENVQVKNGHLIITAEKNGDNYYSGRINTKGKFQFKYGKIEMRAKLPDGYGIWPAFWMLGSDIDKKGWPAAGEIDVMEYVGKMPDTIHNSLHTTASHGNTENTQTTQIPNLTEGFHTFSATWSAQSIVFAIDGRITYRFSPKNKTPETYPFRNPFYVLINLAVGGDFGGPKVDDSIFPAKYIVDYIKVYKGND